MPRSPLNPGSRSPRHKVASSVGSTGKPSSAFNIVSREEINNIEEQLKNNVAEKSWNSQVEMFCFINDILIYS